MRSISDGPGRRENFPDKQVWKTIEKRQERCGSKNEPITRSIPEPVEKTLKARRRDTAGSGDFLQSDYTAGEFVPQAQHIGALPKRLPDGAAPVLDDVGKLSAFCREHLYSPEYAHVCLITLDAGFRLLDCISLLTEHVPADTPTADELLAHPDLAAARYLLLVQSRPHGPVGPDLASILLSDMLAQKCADTHDCLLLDYLIFNFNENFSFSYNGLLHFP